MVSKHTQQLYFCELPLNMAALYAICRELQENFDIMHLLTRQYLNVTRAIFKSYMHIQPCFVESEDFSKSYFTILIEILMKLLYLLSPLHQPRHFRITSFVEVHQFAIYRKLKVNIHICTSISSKYACTCMYKYIK